LLGLLRRGMKVDGHILEVGLQLLDHRAIFRPIAVLPERAAEVVALDELVLAVEHQLAEAALAISLYGLHREIRGFIGVGIACHVGPVRRRGILEPLLVTYRSP